MKRLLFILLLLPVFVEGQIITTVAGGGTGGDGVPATSASINDPTWLTFDKQGNYYIVEGLGNKVRKVDASTGIIITFAGTGSTAYNGSGGLANTTNMGTGSATFDNSYDYLYIPDGYNNIVRKVNMLTNIITTSVGNGTPGYSGDGGPAISAMLNSPNDVCFDKFGNTYINDADNYRVRKIDTAGIISTYAGNGISGVGADSGPATSVELGLIRGITTDDSGNLYIADEGNVDNCIWKVSTTGIITTFAGNHTVYAYNGDNVPATTAAISPVRVVFHSGNFYIADFYNNRIRMVDNAGIIHTIAGTGTVGFSGDGGPADSAELNGPSGIAFDSCGNLYITQVNDGRIRKVEFNPSCLPEKVNILAANNLIIYPNPATTSLTITAPIGVASVAISNLIGQVLYTHQYNSPQIQVDVSDLPAGMYLVRVNGAEVRRFVKE